MKKKKNNNSCWFVTYCEWSGAVVCHSALFPIRTVLVTVQVPDSDGGAVLRLDVHPEVSHVRPVHTVPEVQTLGSRGLIHRTDQARLVIGSAWCRGLNEQIVT